MKLTTSRGIMGRCAGAKSARMPCNNTMHTKHSQIPCKIKLLQTRVLFTWAGYHWLNWKQTSYETLCFSVCGGRWASNCPLLPAEIVLSSSFQLCITISSRLLWEWQTEKNRKHVKKKQSVKHHGSIYTFVHRHKQSTRKESSSNTSVHRHK